MNEKLKQTLLAHMNKEVCSAYIYIAMAAELDAQNWKGMATWMKIQAQEEWIHVMKIYNYLIDRNIPVKFSDIPAPQESIGSPLKIFQAALEHEKSISSCFHNLVKLAREVDDVATEIFLSWFVTEQIEEESQVTEVVDMLEKVGDSSIGLFQIDAILAKRPQPDINQGAVDANNQG